MNYLEKQTHEFILKLLTMDKSEFKQFQENLEKREIALGSPGRIPRRAIQEPMPVKRKKRKTRPAAIAIIDDLELFTAAVNPESLIIKTKE